MIFGGGLLLVFTAFALLLASVGRIARERGRSVALWAFVGAGAGVAAFVLGFAVFDQAMHGDISTSVMLLGVFAPPAFMITAMVSVWLYLHRSRVQVSQRDEWKVHFVGRGDGAIKVTGYEVRLEWPDGSRTLQQTELETIEADGECVRIKAADLELSALPTGKPDSPAGRREQSQALARRLRSPLPRVTTRT